jgi:hypothetical protein
VRPSSSFEAKFILLPPSLLGAFSRSDRWNQALQRVQEVQLRIDQHIHGYDRARLPSRKEFEDLANELESVWNSPDANMRLKKRIVRTLIHEVVIEVDADHRTGRDRSGASRLPAVLGL